MSLVGQLCTLAAAASYHGPALPFAPAPHFVDPYSTRKVLYAMAEVETMRRRTKQQVEDAKNFGVEKFAKNILEV